MTHLLHKGKSIGIKAQVKGRTINKNNLTVCGDHAFSSLLLKHSSFDNFEMLRQKSRIIPRKLYNLTKILF